MQTQAHPRATLKVGGQPRAEIPSVPPPVLPAVFSVARGVHAAISGPVPIVGPSAFFGLLFVHAERTHSTSNPFKNNHLASSPNEPNPVSRAGAAFSPRSPKNPKRTHFSIPTLGSPVPSARFTKRTQIPHNNHKIHNLPSQKPLKPGPLEARPDARQL